VYLLLLRGGGRGGSGAPGAPPLRPDLSQVVLDKTPLAAVQGSVCVGTRGSGFRVRIQSLQLRAL